MKNKSPKLILGIILLVIAIIVWLTNLTSYWIAIALAAIGLILIISRSSDNVIKEETPVVKTEEPREEEEIVEPVMEEEIPATPTEEVVEPIETPAPVEESEKETEEEGQNF